MKTIYRLKVESFALCARMRIIELREEELDELIHLLDYASCEDNLASSLFDKLTAIKNAVVEIKK